MFQAQNRETINCTWKVAVSVKIIMTTSVTRPCFTTQHQTCKTKTIVCKTKTKTDFVVSDLSCSKTDGLRPHHWQDCSCCVYRWESYSSQFGRRSAAAFHWKPDSVLCCWLRNSVIGWRCWPIIKSVEHCAGRLLCSEESRQRSAITVRRGGCPATWERLLPLSRHRRWWSVVWAGMHYW